MRNPLATSHSGLMAAGFLAFFFALLTGCDTRGSGKVVVDFSKIVPVEKPGAEASEPPLRVAVGAMISPKETFDQYRELALYVGNALERDIELVQRKTYQEVSTLLARGDIDIAFICSGPYALLGNDSGLDLLVAPQVDGSSQYHAYLIVHRDSPHTSLEDLRGRTFAFTDPDSNTGRVVPLHWLASTGETPESFFRETFYTYSHDNSILAVAKGLADGASVDGLIWEYVRKTQPELAARTRVIRRSEPMGIPPVVSSRSLDMNTRERVRRVLLGAHEDEKGGKILKALMIERFVKPEDSWYESIRTMRRDLRAALEDN